MNFDVIIKRTARHTPDPLLQDPDNTGAWIACAHPEDLWECR